MIIVDRALAAHEAQGKAIRVGMIGAGFMGQGLTNQIVNSVRGMRMAAIYNRKPERAIGVYKYSGCEDVVVAKSQSALDEAIRGGKPAVAEDPFTICRSPEIDIVANATGFKVRSRGMSRGLKFEGSIMDAPKLYDLEELRALGGIVDYTVGPSLVKVFCLAEHPDPKQRHYLNLYKMGEGPLYPFWIPYHLVHFEAPNAIARVALFQDDVAESLGGPVVEVCAVAKRDLKAGEVLDEYGMYMTYGEAGYVEGKVARPELPQGLLKGRETGRGGATAPGPPHPPAGVPATR